MKRKLTLLNFLSLFFLSSVLMAQVDVSGTITDSNGEAMIGASVTEKNTNNGTITDFNGYYELTVAEDAILQISYVGYKDQEVAVNGQSNLDITLQDGKLLDEVVVTALGITREKKALGYAVDEVDGDVIEDSGQNSVVSALQGRSAGLQVFSTSGAVGAGSTVTIRGVNSLDPNRSNRPLYVIDGMEVSDDVLVGSNLTSASSFGLSTGSATQTSTGNRIMDLNPEDVASVSVLKGAAATALYGVRASNGVIVITTKRGQSGKPRVDISYSKSWSSLAKSPSVQTDFIDGHRSTSKKRSFLFDSWGAKVVPESTSEPKNVYEEFYGRGTSDRLNASVSAGNEFMNYRLSVGNLDQTGIVPESYYKKTNASLGLDFKLSDKLEAQTNFSYTNSRANTPSEGRKSIMNVLNYMTVTADVHNYETPYTYGGNAFAGIMDHPLFLARNISNESQVNRVLGSAKLTYNFTDNLSANYQFGLDHFSDSRERIVHPETDEGQSAVNGSPYGFMAINNYNHSSITSNAYLQYQKDFGDDWGFTGVLGQYMYSKNLTRTSIIGKQFEIDNFFNLNNTLDLEQSNEHVRYRNLAAYAELTLSFRNYIYATVTGRNDWTSTLPVDNRSYFFPSFSLSWIVSDMIDIPEPISFMKLRASYAIAGKDASVYSIGRYYDLAGGFPFDEIVGYGPLSSIGDENLKPEFSKTLELGIDLRFLENRLGLEASYFNTTSENMILPVPVSNTSGVSSVLTNAGTISSNGFELSMDYDLIRNSDWNFNIGANFSKYVGIVEDISLGEDQNEIILADVRNVVNKFVEGERVGDLYGRPFNRTDDGTLILDASGLPTLNTDTLVYMGSALPDFVLGMTSRIQYKGFAISVLAEWKKGGKAIDVGRAYSLDNGQVEETLGRWQSVVFDGVTEGPDGKYVENNQEVEITPEGFYRNSSRHRYAPEAYLKRTDWFRIRNLAFSYTLDKDAIGWDGIERIKFSLIGNNIYLSTPYRGFDPESNFFGAGTNIQGYTGMRTPNTKSWELKANITF